jgi:hypothetical protein
MVFARDVVVDAADTGIRGLELLKGGEIFGGGAIMFARSNGLFWACCIARLLSRLPGVLLGELVRLGEFAFLLGLADFGVALIDPLVTLEWSS